MPEYLRVKQRDTGHELSVTRSRYDFAPDAYDVLEKKPATNRAGIPVRAKLKTTVGKAAAKKTAAKRSTNSATKETASTADEAGQSADTEKEN